MPSENVVRDCSQAIQYDHREREKPIGSNQVSIHRCMHLICACLSFYWMNSKSTMNCPIKGMIENRIKMTRNRSEEYNNSQQNCQFNWSHTIIIYLPHCTFIFRTQLSLEKCFAPTNSMHNCLALSSFLLIASTETVPMTTNVWKSLKRLVIWFCFSWQRNSMVIGQVGKIQQNNIFIKEIYLVISRTINSMNKNQW